MGGAPVSRGLGAQPPAGPRGRAPCRGLGGQSPPDFFDNIGPPERI